MSHGNVKRDLGWPSPNLARMENGEFYQLRGWSAVQLEEHDGYVLINLFSYDSKILSYNPSTNELKAGEFERPYDVSTTTTRHINEFIRFLWSAVGYCGTSFDVDNATTDYSTKHTTGEWYFRGWSGDYDDKPFWW